MDMAPRDTLGKSPPAVDELSNRVQTLVSDLSSRVFSDGRAPGEPSADATERHPPPDGHIPKQQRIERLLDANGGRIYQRNLVESTDWSKATVSRTLREMEQSGAVVRLQVGKQKVVCDQQHVPEWVETGTSD